MEVTVEALLHDGSRKYVKIKDMCTELFFVEHEWEASVFDLGKATDRKIIEDIEHDIYVEMDGLVSLIPRHW